MSVSASGLEISEEQALYFRAKRSHLAGPGAASAVEAAHDILGAQAQVEAMALFALSARTASRPTAQELRTQIYEAPRTLVRTWGQRDTVHVYSAGDHWASVIAAAPEWGRTGRRVIAAPESAVDEAEKVVEELGIVSRDDLLSIVPSEYLAAIEEQVRSFNIAPDRFAAGRLRFAAGGLIWQLAYRGATCTARRKGQIQFYASRRTWFPDLEWRPPTCRQACLDLARLYLSCHAPARAPDMAHFFGAKVSSAKVWLSELEAAGELVATRCGDRKGLFALAVDAQELLSPAPRGRSEWPLRLLPQWDTLLMGHADKSWTVPMESERTSVWRKSAVVASVALARGRVVGTWAQKATRRKLTVTLTPLRGWRNSVHAGQTKRETRALAAHLGLSEAELVIR